jgi:hypothetical protein
MSLVVQNNMEPKLHMMKANIIRSCWVNLKFFFPNLICSSNFSYIIYTLVAKNKKDYVIQFSENKT